MPEYIERNAAIAELVEDMNNDCGMYNSYKEKMVRDERYEFAIDKLREFSSADVAPIRHGKWIIHEIEDTLRWRECSVCKGEIHNVNYNYCPHCGAKMNIVNKEI